MWIDGIEYVDGSCDMPPIEVATLDQLRAHVAELRATGVLPNESGACN
jgi:hypothetical protein